jgi:competence protein ComEA
MKILRILLLTLLATGIAAAQGAAAKPKPAKPGAGKPPAADSAKAAVIDINSASMEELQSIPGIGPVHAKGIVAGRPYRAKNELVQKKVVSEALYNKIKDRIIARQ